MSASSSSSLLLIAANRPPVNTRHDTTDETERTRQHGADVRYSLSLSPFAAIHFYFYLALLYSRVVSSRLTTSVRPSVRPPSSPVVHSCTTAIRCDALVRDDRERERGERIRAAISGISRLQSAEYSIELRENERDSNEHSRCCCCLLLLLPQRSYDRLFVFLRTVRAVRAHCTMHNAQCWSTHKRE